MALERLEKLRDVVAKLLDRGIVIISAEVNEHSSGGRIFLYCGFDDLVSGGVIRKTDVVTISRGGQIAEKYALIDGVKVFELCEVILDDALSA